MIVEPQALIDAAGQLAAVRASLDETSGAAVAATTNAAAMGADEVSAAVNALFQGFAAEYQQAQACASQSWADFEQNLIDSARGYRWVEDDVTTDMGTYHLFHKERVPQPYWLRVFGRYLPLPDSPAPVPYLVGTGD